RTVLALYARAWHRRRAPYVGADELRTAAGSTAAEVSASGRARQPAAGDAARSRLQPHLFRRRRYRGRGGALARQRRRDIERGNGLSRSQARVPLRTRRGDDRAGAVACVSEAPNEETAAWPGISRPTPSSNRNSIGWSSSAARR